MSNAIDKNKQYLYNCIHFFSLSKKDYAFQAILNILNISNYYDFDITLLRFKHDSVKIPFRLQYDTVKMLTQS